jgi:hypothetical protein
MRERASAAPAAILTNPARAGGGRRRNAGVTVMVRCKQTPAGLATVYTEDGYPIAQDKPVEVPLTATITNALRDGDLELLGPPRMPEPIAPAVQGAKTAKPKGRVLDAGVGEQAHATSS